ncbi:MAG: hypothetical protein JNN12_00760 [Bacteroidetes Order II. Incertae sedis bacterium]|nr:hypothetical protein [Bacteroidetes Order II. bacterium]
MRIAKLFFVLTVLTQVALAQESGNRIKDRFTASAYGVMHYNVYNWQILPNKRNDIQFERAVLEASFRADPNWTLHTELEIEHGGTGVTLEFDPLEEFGEFEYEVEKGGEIWFEQFHLRFSPNPAFNLQFGRVKVPFGLMTFFDEPTEYRTTHLSEMENTLLPTHWSEYGVVAKAHLRKKWEVQAGLVNGLDGSAFNAANFIKRGNQKRFESVNANDWAGVARIDYRWDKHQFVGIAGYIGNTRNNRPKPDLQVDAYLTLLEAHLVMDTKPLMFQAIGLLGQLQNSEQVSNANRNLSNNLNVKRTPVGKQALGASAELALRPDQLIPTLPKDKLSVFGRYDYIDTHFATQGSVFNNPRWERSTWTMGLNLIPHPWLVFKAQFARQKLGIPTQRYQNTFSMGFGLHLN